MRPGRRFESVAIATAEVQNAVRRSWAGYMTADSFVFQSRRGANRAIGRVQAWRILRRAFEQAGLTGNLGTHSMRKTFADRVYDRLDGDLVNTARALAHRSISSSASYLTFRESEIDEAILSI